MNDGVIAFDTEGNLIIANAPAVKLMMLNKNIKKFEERAYLISPLGRIAIKFGRKLENIIRELYNDDLQLMILNELYNNNIKVTLLEENLYQVTCKYKSFSSVMTMITASMKDIFYTMFQNMVDIKLECVIKE